MRHVLFLEGCHSLPPIDAPDPDEGPKGVGTSIAAPAEPADSGPQGTGVVRVVNLSREMFATTEAALFDPATGDGSA